MSMNSSLEVEDNMSRIKSGHKRTHQMSLIAETRSGGSKIRRFGIRPRLGLEMWSGMEWLCDGIGLENHVSATIMCLESIATTRRDTNQVDSIMLDSPWGPLSCLLTV